MNADEWIKKEHKSIWNCRVDMGLAPESSAEVYKACVKAFNAGDANGCERGNEDMVIKCRKAFAEGKDAGLAIGLKEGREENKGHYDQKEGIL